MLKSNEESNDIAISLKYFSIGIGVIFLLFVFGVIQNGLPTFFSGLTLEDFYASIIILAGAFILFHLLRQSRLVLSVYKKIDRLFAGRGRE